MHRGTRCPLGFTPFSASRNCTRTSLATRSRKFYSTGSIWATIRKTIPRRNSTSLTASQSDGSPTISETQTPQKHERELVTLEFLESVSKLHQGLQSFRSMRRMEASFKKARPLQLRFSQSLARRRQRLSQAIVRSTIQRLGSCTNPDARSDRLMISVLR